MDLGPAHAFSSEDKSTIEKNLHITQSIDIDPDDIDEYFEILSISNWIEENQYKRVALQFPDELLANASRVASRLESVINVKPYILADTSYGSCCVDEVAAQHVDADSIVHYGETCMSTLHGRTPVRYVLQKDPMDLDNFSSTLNEFKSVHPEHQQLIFVVDLNYLHLKSQIIERISKIFGIEVKIEFRVDFSTNFDQKSIVFYVGRSEKSIKLTLLMMINPICRFFSYDPSRKMFQSETADVNKMLKKRLFLVEKAKDANIIGIVIGSLSIANYLSVLERLKILCKKSKKTYYILSVGKLNVPKLSNFAEIDVFVLLTCPYNLIFDWSEYYRPIITPFEFEIACDPSKFWMAGLGWTPEICSVLQESSEAHGSDQDKETDISLISGRLRNLNPDVDYGDGSIIKRSDAMQIQLVSAENHFANRSWKGLEEKLGETPVGKVKEGRSGIAMEYKNESKK